jgi:hypothetical protein
MQGRRKRKVTVPASNLKTAAGSSKKKDTSRIQGDSVTNKQGVLSDSVDDKTQCVIEGLTRVSKPVECMWGRITILRATVAWGSSFSLHRREL